ncbi:hypothetical protein BSZ19_35565 [Bradyrhizobium japonicum]|uniref:OmpR/PhoB-type domain-containing protein n=1 Tax=Bradyrhizobium japonicum TaxID=375 RepID=A0A1Y2JFT0_BRAJP|nr:hypothetical protein BSZ19_35565 [Bradyrhizobium japonicum]
MFGAAPRWVIPTTCERNDVASFGPLRLLIAERLLEKAGEPLELGGRALDILITLVERAGEVVTPKELISRVWPDVIVEEANLRVHISGLRKALEMGAMAPVTSQMSPGEATASWLQ